MSERKILVVDDEQNIVKVVGRILETLGYTVLGAHDLGQAKQVLQQQGPMECALLDFSLGGSSCAEAFAALRDTQRDLKVVLMSGFGLAEVRQSFPQADQCAAFLKKPFGLDALMKVVGSVCAPARSAPA